MSEILGKKRFNIDQAPPKARTSVAGSGWMIMLAGTPITSPIIDISLVLAITEINNSPAFDAPTIAWT